MKVDIEQKLNTLTHYFDGADTDEYIGEAVSQLEHALQAAYFAEQAGHCEEVVFACLLHDLGHYASTTQQNNMAELGVVFHEWIGAFLAYQLNFSAKVALLIGYHVDAKCYLAGKNERYYKRLSPASQQTLAFQGGPMGEKERLAFEQLPYFKEILQVRVNDEKAKQLNLLVPDLNYYLPKIRRHIEAHSHSHAEEPLPDFVNANWVMSLKNHLLKQDLLGCVVVTEAHS